MAIVIAGIKRIFDNWQQMRQFRADFEFRQMKDGLESANRQMKIHLELLDIAKEKEKGIVDVQREQINALREAKKAQLELNKAKELEGVESETERTRIEERYATRMRGIDAEESETSYANKVEDIDREIEKLEKEILLKEEDADVTRSYMAQYQRRSRINFKQADGFWTRVGRFFGGNAGEFNLEEGKRYGEEASRLADEYQDALQEIEKKKNDLDRMKSQRDNLVVKVGSGEKSPERMRIEADRERAESEARDRRARENRRIDMVKRRRAREEELHEYDRDLAETNYQRGRRSPWQNDVEQLAEAEKMLERYRREEKEALDERERVMKEVAAQGGWQTITEEQEFRFNNATSDLQRARSSRYQEQSTIDQLEKALHDRRFDESEARHTIEKEDADWERNRIYSRANYAQKLAMDRRRYAAAQKEYAEADAAILADNAGTRTLSPEERRVMERRRTEARAYMTETREAISNALYEGDAQRMGFYNSLMKQGNRLTAMGLGGDVANWDKQTANNTKTLVSQNRDLLQYFRSDHGANGGLAMKWGL